MKVGGALQRCPAAGHQVSDVVIESLAYLCPEACDKRAHRIRDLFEREETTFDIVLVQRGDSPAMVLLTESDQACFI